MLVENGRRLQSSPLRKLLLPRQHYRAKAAQCAGARPFLTSMAVAFGVIELVLFSAVAGLFGVTVDVNTMPTNWLVAFYALFLVPASGCYSPSSISSVSWNDSVMPNKALQMDAPQASGLCLLASAPLSWHVR